MRGAMLILGASSAIARSIADELAAQGYPLVLAGRDLQEQQRTSSDLHIRHRVVVESLYFDAEDFSSHPAFVRQVIDTVGSLEGVVVGFGYLGDAEQARHDFSEAQAIIQRNYTGAVSVLSPCADYFEKQGRGIIVGIASVAGDRGRQSNYLYGSAKGAFALYLQGLRNRLCRANVRVLTVKPGFVDTAMTYGMPGLFLVASPQAVAQRIVRAMQGGADEIYVPWFWRYIMLIIRSIPEIVFKRLSL